MGQSQRNLKEQEQEQDLICSWHFRIWAASRRATRSEALNESACVFGLLGLRECPYKLLRKPVWTVWGAHQLLEIHCLFGELENQSSGYRGNLA